MSEVTIRLSRPQLALLAEVLDEVIPARDDRALPGAGGLGVAEYIEAVLQRSPESRPMLHDGLDAVQACLTGRGAARLGDLAAAERAALVGEQPFLFFLMFHGYAGYYQQARVLEALGLEGRAPHPLGYAVAPDDLSILAPVRARGRLYREVP